ncbi:lariat debranching enzyme [Geranomyces variabilis]|uniref:Lariat debranching enzyme n=1 Tax=Geranomyces variabilis TaxID=109894 RepID=A0AAD5TEX7_9FUNG|nr:lariat debranching enzyme [Geranomyces variabilis]
MRIAIEGCCHGELDRIYASLANLQRLEKFSIDLLLICGDFQSIRNTGDLSSLACPGKYRALGTFYKYYSGEKRAPIPTIFIGGNHEASSYLWELYHGGWVAPNIYYLGFAGVVNFGGLRISGLSGIFKKQDYDCGYFEKQPFNDNGIRSVYHVRKFNVYRLAQIRQPIDIMLSHDWPRGIAMHGNTRQLVQNKPFLAGEINTNTLGSYPSEFLLKRLRPNYWFAAHLHVKFAAIYNHEQTAPVVPQPPPDEKDITAAIVDNPDEINIGSDEESDGEVADGDAPVNGQGDAAEAVSMEARPVKGELSKTEADGSDAVKSQDLDTDGNPASAPGSPEIAPAGAKQTAKFTKFLALDKCLPGHDFLQIVNFPEADDSSLFLSYDEEWLAIMRATHDLFSTSREQKKVPEDSEIARRIAEDLQWVQENVPDLRAPHNFVVTSPAHTPSANSKPNRATRSGKPYLNPQTTALCDLLGLPNNINVGGLAPGTVDPALAPLPRPPPPPPPPPKAAKRVKLALPPPKKEEPMEGVVPTDPRLVNEHVLPVLEPMAVLKHEAEKTSSNNFPLTTASVPVQAEISYADNEEPEYQDYKTEEDEDGEVEEGETDEEEEGEEKTQQNDEILFLTRFLGKGDGEDDEEQSDDSDDGSGDEAVGAGFSIDNKGSPPF